MKRFCILLLLLCLFTVACGEEKAEQSVDTSESVTSEVESVEMPESSEFIIVTADTYTVGKLEMSLPWELTNQEVDDVELYAYNDEFVLVVTTEGFDELKANGHELYSTAADYAKAFISNAELETPMYAGEDGSIAWFEYAQDMDNGRFHYFAYCFMGSDAYYMCQFVCEEAVADGQRELIIDTVLNFKVN